MYAFTALSRRAVRRLIGYNICKCLEFLCPQPPSSPGSIGQTNSVFFRCIVFSPNLYQAPSKGLMVSVPCPHRQLHAPGKAPTLIHKQVPLPGQWIERYSLSGSKVCKVSYKWVGRATGIFKAGHAAKSGAPQIVRRPPAPRPQVRQGSPDRKSSAR